MSKETRNGKTLEAWLRDVDKVLIRRCGLTTGDLADQCYWDMWNDEVAPSEAAQVALDYEGFPDA